jgi:CubicO group peptidase (beta-lactamase class C family)
MRAHVGRSVWPGLCLASALVGVVATLGAQAPPAPPAPAAAETDDTRVPGAEWTRVRPESVGYASERLEALRAWLKTQQTKAMVVAIAGRVIFEYGDVAHASKVASIRKSILGMLYGKYVASGAINLGRTVQELGLQEAEPFLPIETHATVEALLTARSGIYLRSGNDQLDAVAPKRGSEAPGTRHQYNNWDFNAAGTAFEKMTGRDIYGALETDLARPLAMQDFQRAAQGKVPSPGSVHPEYVMRLSTRDLARLGVLMLRGGAWRGTQVLPVGWSRYLTTLVTPFDRIHPTGLSIRGRFDRWGYGVMWWVWEEPLAPGGASMGPLQGAYTAMGAGGQYVTVLPDRGMVIAHTVDIERGANDVSPMAFDAILAMAVESACPDPSRCPGEGATQP